MSLEADIVSDRLFDVVFVNMVCTASVSDRGRVYNLHVISVQ